MTLLASLLPKSPVLRWRAGSRTPPAGWLPQLPAGLTAWYAPEARGGVAGYRMEIAGTVSGSTAPLFIDFSQLYTLAVNTDVIDAHFNAQVITDDADITTLYACTVERASGGAFLSGTYADFFATRTALAQRDCDRTCNQATTHHVTVEFLSSDLTSGTAVNFVIWFGGFFCANLG